MRIHLEWLEHYRIIPSKFPPINFFENLVDPDLMEEVFYLESLTNDRLRDEVGEISLVSKEDRVSGPGSSVVMAAFTHPGGSRFSDGSFGIYYASKELETAIYETIHHTEIFLGYTNEPPGEHTKRVYKGKSILQPLIDIRGSEFAELHDPHNLIPAKDFGHEMKRNNEWGIVYNSVRHDKGECIAIFRPVAIELPINQTMHLQYQWDGKRITHVVELGRLLI